MSTKVTVYRQNDQTQRRDITAVGNYLIVPDSGDVSTSGEAPITKAPTLAALRDVLFRMLRYADDAALERPLPFSR